MAQKRQLDKKICENFRDRGTFFEIFFFCLKNMKMTDSRFDTTERGTNKSDRLARARLLDGGTDEKNRSSFFLDQPCCSE